MSDERAERIIAALLRTGVTIAAALVLAGGLVYLARHFHEPADYHVFRGEPAEFRAPMDLFEAAGQFPGRTIIQTGLLLLIATPVARVAFSVVAFALEGDRTYVVVTLAVLGILVYSLIGSR